MGFSSEWSVRPCTGTPIIQYVEQLHCGRSWPLCSSVYIPSTVYVYTRESGRNPRHTGTWSAVALPSRRIALSSSSILPPPSNHIAFTTVRESLACVSDVPLFHLCCTLAKHWNREVGEVAGATFYLDAYYPEACRGFFWVALGQSGGSPTIGHDHLSTKSFPFHHSWSPCNSMLNTRNFRFSIWAAKNICINDV